MKKCGNTILFKDMVWQSLNEAILQSCSQVCTCCSDLWCSLLWLNNSVVPIAHYLTFANLVDEHVHTG